MPHVLLVEDSATLAADIKSFIEKELGFQVTWKKTLKEVRSSLASGDFTAALTGFSLPDAPDGKAVDYLVRNGIPTIVVTDDCTEEIRSLVWAKGIVDYLPKGDGLSLDYLASLLRRIHNNRSTKILLVDDDSSFLSYLSGLLKIHQYIVLTAADGAEAEKILEADPGIKLVITDYAMPGLDGFGLARSIRRLYGRDQVSIIGMAGAGEDNFISARFLKAGANDFMHKGFLEEELYLRISQNIEMLERIAEVRESSFRDHLTGLHSRSCFFELAEKVHAGARKQHAICTAVMIDLDYFKLINDKLGHEAGDHVLRDISAVLSAGLRKKDILARFGGEEFCIYFPDTDPEDVYTICENFRENLENSVFTFNGKSISLTASIGIGIKSDIPLQDLVTCADNALYMAKKNGRNRVVIHHL